MGWLSHDSLSHMQRLCKRGHVILVWTKVTTLGGDGVL
jgi:hypothetical protein